jgi:drug/metabolite transporter (DMT)-like permease
MSSPRKNVLTGIGLALLAVVIWSGNFIAARKVFQQMPPVSLAFYRWITASVVLLPIAISSFIKDWPVIRKALPYLFWAALTGITLFNTFVYIGAHYTTAINLSLIGTTSSPVIAVILARIFLKEQLSVWKIGGMVLCIAGVLYLLAKGNLENLIHLRFTRGDGWVLLAAASFAVYNTLVKKKPKNISPLGFLLSVFWMGTLVLLPFYLWEVNHTPAVDWDYKLVLIILFLGIGASVIAFLSWNLAVGHLGAGRTALFGNLIPVFSSIEAALLLHEDFTNVHIVSMVLVFAGIVVANRK